MKKYLAAARNEWQRIMEYHFSVFSFRIGNFLEIFAQLIIWSIIYDSVDIISGYSYREMVSYIIIGYLFSFLTANYAYETNIAKSIHSGQLSNILCKPISWFAYVVSISFGRVYVTLISSLGMQLLLLALFYNSLIAPPSVLILFLLFLMIIVGFLIKLFFAIIVGMMAFFVVNVSGIYFSLRVLTSFFSGAYFTLALLPAGFLKIALFLPFAYTFFVPSQIYLGKMTAAQGWQGLLISIIWLLALYLSIKIVWRIGLKKYEAVGI